MASQTEVGIKLTLQGEQQVKSALSGVESEMSRLSGSIAKVGHYGSAFLLLTQGINPAIGALVNAADAVTTLNNQLKLATGSTLAAGRAYEALFDIAQRSRVSFTELGGTFASISRAGQELGLSQQRLLGVTEAIGNAMSISGGSAQSMQAALVQLSQGLASGTLRGEELNSVMEQSPRLAKALADGMNVPIGKLRELGETGQISAEQVIGALESQAAVLKGEVAGAALTVGQAMTQLQNATTMAVGEMDKATGTSKTIAEAMSFLATTVGEVGKAFKDNEAAIKTGMGVLAGAGVGAGALAVAANIGKITAAVRVLSVALSANPYVLAVMGIGAAVGGFAAMSAARENSLEGMRATLKELQSLESKGDRGMYGTRVPEEALAKRRAEIKRLQLAIVELDSTNLDTRAEDARLAGMVRNTKAADADRDAYVKLSRTLNGFKGDYKEYTDNQALIKRLRDSGAISEKEAANRLGELAKKHGLVSDSAKKSADVSKLAADSLKKSYQDAMGAGAQQARDLTANTDSLNAAEKKLVDIMAEPAWAKWTETQREAVKALFDRNSETIKAQELAKAEAKWMDESAAENLKFSESAFEAADAVEKQVQEQLLANQAIGLSAVALADLEAARLRDAAAEKIRRAELMQSLDPKTAESYRREAAAIVELADARQAGATKQASVDANKVMQDAWRKTADKIEDALTDALMRGFESGKGFAETLRDTVVNMFKTMVLRPVVQAIVAPVMGAFGMPASAGQAGSFGPMEAYNAYKTATTSEWFTNFGGSLSDAAYNAGGSLYRAGFESMGDSAFEAGKFLSDFSAEINMAGDALGYLNAAAMASEGRWGAAIGSAAGTYFGGPIGSFIGSTIGSAIDEVFAGDSGTMHRGGAYSIDTAGNGYTANNSNTAGFGLGWGAFRSDRSAGIDDALKVFSTGLAATMQSALKNFGVAESYRITAKFASDNNDGSVGGLRIANSAGDVISSFDRSNFASDPEKGFTEFSAAAAASIRDALVAADIPGWAQSALKAIGDTPSLDQLSAAVANINSVSAALLSMADVMPQLAGLSDDATTGLLSVFGGIENLKSATAGYYQNFYTETERTATATRQVSEAMADIGLAMPETRDGFRALVEAQDLTTEAGRSTYAALMQLQGAFVGVADAAAASAQQLEQQMVDGLQASFDAFTSLASTSAGYGDTSGLTDYLVGLQNSFDFAGSIGAQKSVLDAMAGAEAAIADARQSSAQAELQAISARKTALQDELTSAQALLGAAQGLRKYVQDLRASAASPLSDAEKLNVLAARYSMQVSLARAGDVDSLSSVQGTASAYLDVLKAQSRTSEDYALAFAKVAGELDTLGSTTETAADQQVRLLQDQMDAIDRQTAAMESIQGVSRATKDLTESLLSKAREQLVQGLQSASAQLIATDSISENLKKLPPELASVLSSVIASSLSPMIASLASAVGSSISSAQVAQAAQQAATGSVTVADVYETVGASTKSAGLAYATSPGGIGQDAYYKAIRDNVAAVDLSSKAAIYGLKSAADQWGVSAYDISKATGYSYKDVLDTFQKAGIPAFAVGTNYVPRDTLAVVHEGEAIVPKAFNPAAMQGGAANTERLERLVEALTAEVKRLQNVVQEGNYETRRAADAVNGRPEQPMPVTI